jgi:hypothetical protein
MISKVRHLVSVEEVAGRDAERPGGTGRKKP